MNNVNNDNADRKHEIIYLTDNELETIVQQQCVFNKFMKIAKKYRKHNKN